MRFNVSLGQTTLAAIVGFGVFTSGLASAATTSTVTISGTPITQIAPKTFYMFTPKASTTSGRRLRFTVENSPSWTWFSNNKGVLYGWPRQNSVGTYKNIVIAVSDGISTARLAPFSITVGTPAPAPTPTPTPAPAPTPTPTPTPAPAPAPAPAPTPTPTPTPAPAPAPAPTPTPTPTPAPAPAPAPTPTPAPAPAPAPAPTPTPAPAPAPTTGSATLNWTPPLANTDGSSLTNIAGYRIAYGQSAGSLTQTVNIPSAGVASYTVENLALGTWYFAVKAYNSAGTESALTNPVSTTIK